MEDLKFDKGKPMVDLIEPEFILKLGEVLELGARKYKPNSWQKIKNAEDRYYAAAMRHLLQYRSGEHADSESGLSHLYHAACNLMFLAHFEGKKETNNVRTKD